MPRTPDSSSDPTPESASAAVPRIQTFVLGDFQTNCFIVTVPGASEQPGGDPQACWIVDCGYEPDALLDAVEAQGLRPERIVLTHAHADHVAGLDQARARFGPLPVHLHVAERGFCSDPMLNLAAYMGLNLSVGEPDHWLEDGDTLELQGAVFRVVHAPGHSPGCVLLVHDASAQAIVGDTLFAGSIGRVDFPTSDPAAMRRSITERLMALPDDLAIHPGHGPATTIGHERATNPFVLRPAMIG